jgi:hypothetical protein
MQKWTPKEKKIFLVAYDFEWVVSNNKQIPYAYGLYHEGSYL